MCPSGSAFAIPLGPTNPWLIFIAKETLIFRRKRISRFLWLLVPTFFLRNAPVWVTPLPSQQMRILSYRSIIPKNYQTLSFGTMLSPDYLRRRISGWVSCYAFFKGWLLLSQPPHCLRNSTALFALSIDLGTLNRDHGLFPFWPMELSPHSLTAVLLILGIRSLIGLTRFLPVETFQCSTPKRNIRR